MYAIDVETSRIFHDDRVAALRRAALPPAPSDPPRTPRIRRAVGRSLVSMGVKVASDPLLEVRFEPGRPVA